MMNDAHPGDDEGAQVIRLGAVREDAPGGDPPGDDRAPERGQFERSLASGLAFLRRRLTGEYEIDEFGFDPEFNSTVLLPMARALYEHWFRVELDGLDNIPEGGALLVANHSGTIPLDALMLSVALHDHADRQVRLLGADLVYQIPVLGHLSRKAGHTLACKADAARLLGKGELVGVFPEGFKGVGKPFSERYKLQRFGRGGFVGTALRAGVPIVPCAIVGAEEIYPKIAELRPLARLLGLPYFPVTPTFPLLGPAGLVPLPSKWVIRFGEPMTLDGHDADAADDPMTVFEITDHVREKVQHLLYETLLRRGPAFL
ncbi:lysophospholipid acyltransferase family protein [Actinomadura citrea]|jgi:1-acyl-sn-glycerol-3-phosphate acyltransferase|uniref:1-acyl-sn-glycerol-3-phosphate acyltransferase n=1 Tax=Actinomadura citrea TaxID=46158 RepID=A0A7Y9KFK6_9ACTN|nr:lysophospholipid acyltransferase family protein [Actinomadura citrea]NYE17482.1 1-acyl-sn-glycerol-3-phosphate acyltransferase [Actinomadura citrea]GGU01192.1 glycerol acyltransferase [Actinomadura citrea]